MRTGGKFALFLLAALLLAGIATEAVAQAEMESLSQSAPGRRGPGANLSYLLAGFLVVWICLGTYLAAVHRGQRRLEKMIARLEEKRS